MNILDIRKLTFFRDKQSIALFIAITIVAVFTSYPIIKGIEARNSLSSSYDLSSPKDLSVMQGNSLLSISDYSVSTPKNIVQTAIASHVNSVSLAYKETSDSYSTREMLLTAYSSTPEQTDSTPFITASGKSVGDGVVANNMLPFGTKIRIPEIYGDKVFVVLDRLNSRKGGNQVDIWMPSYFEAKEFGVKKTSVEIISE